MIAEESYSNRGLVKPEGRVAARQDDSSRASGSAHSSCMGVAQSKCRRALLAVGRSLEGQSGLRADGGLLCDSSSATQLPRAAHMAVFDSCDTGSARIAPSERQCNGFGEHNRTMASTWRHVQRRVDFGGPIARASHGTHDAGSDDGIIKSSGAMQATLVTGHQDMAARTLSRHPYGP